MQSGRSVRPWISGIARRHQADLVRERIADVDVEHVSAAGHLLGHVHLQLREVARLELCLEGLAAGRVDPLADDAERLLGADDDGPRPRSARLRPRPRSASSIGYAYGIDRHQRRFLLLGRHLGNLSRPGRRAACKHSDSGSALGFFVTARGTSRATAKAHSTGRMMDII